MKIRKLSACLAITIFAFVGSPLPAEAFMNTEQLQSFCKAGLADPTPQNPQFALCTGFIMGILIADALEEHRICLPSAIDTKSALKTFLMRSSMEKDKDIEGLVTMFRAFSEAYPCN